MNTSTLFARFDQHPKRNLLLLFALYLLINNGITASSVWMEATRSGNTPNFHLWEPFVWEYSSALSVLLLLPGLIYLYKHFPLRFERLGQFVALHFVGSLLFAMLHVLLMVAMRELIYRLMGGNYDFGATGREFFYEYRKDVFGYLFMMGLYHASAFIYWRLKGEASLVGAQSEQPQVDAAPEHLLVKKLDKEFLVKVADIEWLESSGNYVNLHAQGRIYPFRSTLKGLILRIESQGFSQIHRSHGVNVNKVKSIASLPSGDGEVTLINGQTLALSRRYKDAFKQKYQ